MPLATWFWMPFFERKVQNILRQIKARHGEYDALWTYCEIAASIIYRDSISYKYCAAPDLASAAVKPNETGRGTSLEQRINLIGTPAAELLLEIAKANDIIRDRPATRHIIAAISEANIEDIPAINFHLGLTSDRPESRSSRDTAFNLLLRFCAPIGNTAQLKIGPAVSWKQIPPPKRAWTAESMGEMATKERNRRRRTLERWPEISQFAPKAILPNFN